MSRLLWLLVTVLAALVAVGAALRLRAGGKSRMHVLARDYLVEQLAAQGIARKVPARYIAEIARRYASMVESRPLGRLAAVAELMRRLDAVVQFLEAWVGEGREFPRSVAEMSLPGAVPDMLEQDVLDSDP